MASSFDKLQDIRNKAIISGTPEGKHWSYPTTWTTCTLEDYQWYPDYGITRGVKDLVDILKISSPAFVETMLNFIDNPSQSIKTTPRIKVFEMEPLPYYQVLLDVYRLMYDTFKDLMTNQNLTQVFENIRNKFSFGSLEKALIDSKIATNMSDPMNLVTRIPGAFYSGMVAGLFLRSTELPYYGDYYMHAKGYEGWSTTTIQSHLGGVSDILKKFGLGGLNIPLYPQFQLEGLGPECDEITVEVNLFNDSFEHLINNTLFLHSFVPGAFWIQSGLLQRGSNFFQVEIPGRCIYYLCKMDCEVTCIGKSRKLNPKVKSSSLTSNDFMYLPPIVADTFDADVPALVPDIYKLKCKFMSILPNNYNSYLYSILNWDTFRAKLGKETKFTVETFLTEFAKIVKQ
jgi:hypothetical protein